MLSARFKVVFKRIFRHFDGWYLAHSHTLTRAHAHTHTHTFGRESELGKCYGELLLATALLGILARICCQPPRLVSCSRDGSTRTVTRLVLRIWSFGAPPAPLSLSLTLSGALPLSLAHWKDDCLPAGPALKSNINFHLAKSHESNS